jgi:hypothetical protein
LQVNRVEAVHNVQFSEIRKENSLMRGVRTVCCALALTAAFLVSPARADEYTKQTFLTFSGPVQLPGITLPAGTYMFKLADPESGRRTLQVWDKDGSKLYTTLLTIPDEKMEASDNPVVMFSERPAGEAQAVRSWFYPGDRFGQEFVYPKDQAMKIARENHASVLAYSDDAKVEDAAAMHSAKVDRVDETSAASTTTAANAPAAATSPSANRTDAAASATAQSSPAPAAPASVSANSANRTAASDTGNRAVGTSGTQNAGSAANQNDNPKRSLPRTAGPLALVELLSGVTLAGAIGVRQLRKYYAENDI